METTQKGIKALDVYYEIALKEFNDSHSHLDGIDNKIGIFIAISVAIPSLLLSTIKISPGTVGIISFGLYCLGFIMLIWLFYHIFQALRVRTVQFGVSFSEFQEACKVFENDIIKESTADMWIDAAKKNSIVANTKATELKHLHLPFFFEILFFISAAILALASNL